jgi:hypothetical protein
LFSYHFGDCKRISEADFATAVPDPIAIPISAFFRAGASFTPTPVCNRKYSVRLIIYFSWFPRNNNIQEKKILLHLFSKFNTH